MTGALHSKSHDALCEEHKHVHFFILFTSQSVMWMLFERFVVNNVLNLGLFLMQINHVTSEDFECIAQVIFTIFIVPNETV